MATVPPHNQDNSFGLREQKKVDGLEKEHVWV